MFITKKHLTRRTLLRGMGTAISLPLLDAMIPAQTALAQTAANPKPRLGYIYFPHGAVMSKWTPKGQGQIGELSEDGVDLLRHRPVDIKSRRYKNQVRAFTQRRQRWQS